MSFRKICEEEEKENSKVRKALQDACGTMRTILKGLNVDYQPDTDRGADTDDSLMEDDYEEQKKIDEQFLLHKEILSRYQRGTSQPNENFEIQRLNFHKIIRIILKVRPSVSSFKDLQDKDLPDLVHSRMDKIGLHAFCQKAGDRRFPHILSKLEVVMRVANSTLFEEESLNLKLSFNEKFQILRDYYKADSKAGTVKSPLRIAGVALLTAVDNFLRETRDHYKRSRQMRKLLGLE